ncbi:MAG TPA: HAMP domain-containing protein, partial [Aquabacterium sp.]|nr:HAMP domain-containing protein [Aquabacterium sp.]
MSAFKANRWAWIVLGLAMFGAGLVLAFMLVLATQNRERFEPHFIWLFWTNVAIASLLAVVIVLALGRLALRVRRRKFGSQLLLKLAGIFAVVSLVPGLLIYGVSYQFVSRSIETWFDVRVEGALEAGLSLGRTTMDTLSQDLADKTRLAAERMSGLPSQADTDSQPPLLELERLREQLGADRVALISEAGALTIQVGGQNDLGLSAGRVPTAWREDARNRGVVSLIEGLDDGKEPRVMALAWMPDRSFSLQSRGRFLLVQQPIPAKLLRNALDVENASREYQQRSLGREGLRRMYIGTLTLSLVLAVFGALLLAATLGQQLARPLVLLAEGVSEVARGDLSPKAIFTTKDELGGLTRDFAAMTQQLADARTQAERSTQQLDNARSRVQTILDNLTSGVIVFNAQGLIDTVNPGATRILRAPL